MTSEVTESATPTSTSSISEMMRSAHCGKTMVSFFR